MNSLNLIRPSLKKKRWAILTGLFCLLIVDFLQLIIPRILKQAVDDLTFLTITTENLLIYACYIIALSIAIGVFRFGWRHYLMGFSREVEEDIRNRLFSHIQTLSASYFDKIKTGDLMAHATNDLHHIRMATGMGLVAFMDAIVLGIATIGFMAYINIRLTMFVLVPMPFIVISARIFSKKMHKAYQTVQEHFSKLTEEVRERYAGIRIIKAYTREADSINKLDRLSEEYIHKNVGLVKITGVFFPIMVFFTNMSLAIVLFWGGRQAVYGIITTGDFVAFISYLGLLTWPMMAMGWLINLIQRGKASLDRINRILETTPDIRDDSISSSFSYQEYRCEIIMENVGFSYEPSGPYALSGINIKIDKGKTLGIVGPPGSGKTSFLSLIPRIYEPDSGRILICGIDIKKMSLAGLRAMISFVPQEPFLFAGTIKDNITFGNPHVPERKIIRAAENAALFDSIKGFPKGFDTVVGEKGVILSGGQKQRIALARALLHDRPILLLDDPVSQVDSETGDKIIRNIKKLKGQKTIIIVSHRLSALKFAHKIITIKKGKITETGTHEELMAADRYYANAFRLQEIEEELDVF